MQEVCRNVGGKNIPTGVPRACVTARVLGSFGTATRGRSELLFLLPLRCLRAPTLLSRSKIRSSRGDLNETEEGRLRLLCWNLILQDK